MLATLEFDSIVDVIKFGQLLEKKLTLVDFDVESCTCKTAASKETVQKACQECLKDINVTVYYDGENIYQYYMCPYCWSDQMPCDCANEPEEYYHHASEI